MNKKDIQRLQAAQRAASESPSTPAPVVPAYEPKDFARAVEQAVAAVVDAHEREHIRKPAIDEPWFRLYCAAVGGQMGWLCSSSDGNKLTQRLGILADIAQSAVNYAINRGKIV